MNKWLMSNWIVNDSSNTRNNLTLLIHAKFEVDLFDNLIVCKQMTYVWLNC